MNLTIHRGSREIGGSCVELASGSSRIVIDIGMPLVEKGGAPFDMRRYRSQSGPNLVARGVLPNVRGLYAWDNDNPRVDALLISHAHIDHYGFLLYVHRDIPVYLSIGAQKLIQLTGLFTNKIVTVHNPHIITAGKPFRCGQFRVVPYLADHSAFDAYAFVVEAGGKTIIYTGDFRGHGKHGDTKLSYFLDHAPKNADAMLMEGTTLGRPEEKVLTEKELEQSAVDIFKRAKGPVLIYQSGQNIDRLVAFFRAARRSDRLFLMDVYTAHVLDTLNAPPQTNLPHASTDYPDIRVFYSHKLTTRMHKDGREQIVFKYLPFKITKPEIAEMRDKVVMVIRPSMMKDLEAFDRYGNALEGGTLIYSLWKGYIENPQTKELLHFAESKNMTIEHLHTSGHATLSTLKRAVQSLKPKLLIPIHTFHPDKYTTFGVDVRQLEDGEVLRL